MKKEYAFLVSLFVKEGDLEGVVFGSCTPSPYEGEGWDEGGESGILTTPSFGHPS